MYSNVLFAYKGIIQIKSFILGRLISFGTFEIGILFNLSCL